MSLIHNGRTFLGANLRIETHFVLCKSALWISGSSTNWNRKKGYLSLHDGHRGCSYLIHTTVYCRLLHRLFLTLWQLLFSFSGFISPFLSNTMSRLWTKSLERYSHIHQPPGPLFFFLFALLQPQYLTARPHHFLHLPPLPSLLRTRPSCFGRVTTRRNHGIQLLGSKVRRRRCCWGGGGRGALRVELADEGHGGRQHRLEGSGDKVAALVEPLAKGAREGDGLGLGCVFGGEGDGEVVERGVLLGGCGYGNLCVGSHCQFAIIFSFVSRKKKKADYIRCLRLVRCLCR